MEDIIVGRNAVREALKNGHGLIVGDMKLLSLKDVSGILPEGGTVLGTTNRDNPFKYDSGEDAKGNIIYKDMSKVVASNLSKRNIDCLIVIGGDGSLHIADELHGSVPEQERPSR